MRWRPQVLFGATIYQQGREASRIFVVALRQSRNAGRDSCGVARELDTQEAATVGEV